MGINLYAGGHGVNGIQLIVTDLDGTLLRHDKTISDYTAAVFDRCKEMGIKIVFATARPVRAITQELNITVQSDAYLCHNGAVVKIGDDLFQENGIENATVKKLLDEIKQIGNTRIAVEIKDTLYANFDASAVWPGVEYTMTDFYDLPILPADKIIIMTIGEAEINKIEQLFDESLYWEISENEVLMIMNNNARKRNAVNAIANHFAISVANIVAFGDDYNDIEMLRDCGIGVAVANAIDEVKVAADYICDTNENDGVAKWLEQNVLLYGH